MNLTDKVLINNLCDWPLYTPRLNGMGSITIPARVKNFAMLDVAEVQMHIQTNDPLFVGNDPARPGDHARLYIVDDVMKQAAKNGVNSEMYVPTPTRNVPEGATWTKDEIREDGMIHIHRFAMYGEGKNPILRALRYCFCEIAYFHLN